MDKATYLALLIAALMTVAAPLQAVSEAPDADSASGSPAKSEEAKADYEALLKEVERIRVEALRAAELAREAALQRFNWNPICEESGRKPA